MHANIGDVVEHPVTQQKGKVLDIHSNPACLIRILKIQWENGTEEEVEELEFGPLED